MKNYLKPQMELNQFNLKENVATISDWVAQNSAYSEVTGITTYYVAS